MKVIVLTPNYPRKGAMMNGYFIHQQIKALRELGVDCQVLLTHNWFPLFGLHKLHPYWRLGLKQKSSYLPQYEDVPIHHVPVYVKMPSRFFYDDPYERESGAIIRYIQNNKSLDTADWLYANFLTDSGYIGALIKQKLGIKLATMARGDDVHAWPESKPALVANLRAVFRNADILLANSKRLSEDLQHWFEPGFARGVSVVYNGVDYHRFSPADSNEKDRLQKKWGLPLGHKFLLCVATPVVLKGWLELLDAIKMLGEDFNEWKLIAVTPLRDSPDTLDLNYEAKKRGIESHVILLGSVNPVDMPDCYRAMDAFILPSYNEGFSNSVLEAMATGLAVIATDVGGHKEVIDNEINGFLIEPQNTQAIVSSLRRLVTNDLVKNRISSAARLEVKNRIGTFKENAVKLKNLLEHFFQK